MRCGAFAKVKKCYDPQGNPFYDDHIITADYDEHDFATELPKYIALRDLKPGELPFMKLRSAQVLRYHKFNKEKNSHEYYYSELQLYHPHSKNSRHSLLKEREDINMCRDTFNTSNLSNVKRKVMEFVESVEEGLEKAQEMIDNTIGDELNPEKEQDKAECEAEGTEDHPNFQLTDPGNLDQEVESASTGLFKTVSLSPLEDLLRLTEILDDDQRLALSKVLKFARQLKMSRSTPIKVEPPLLVVQGGAGAGKSMLIKAIGQWFERELQQSGDDPEKPYILITAFTGTAAANVDGMTLHSAFNFNFGNEFISLGDKTRDTKRDQLKNLKMVIVDEFSMLKADMLYQLDLRLRELKQNMDEPFGGCAIILLGDILQLRPVMGRYIFEEPLCTEYRMAYLIDPLWKRFQVLLLNHNHRQGEDFHYAELLNRVRSGHHTDEDCRVLNQRVREIGSLDIPANALYINCTNKGVNAINEKKLEEMEGEVYSFRADVRRSGKPAKNPKRGRDGSIFNTPLQMDLYLKIGARVMLTYNVDVLDSLTNGAIGKVVGFQQSSENITQAILVQFNDDKCGREKRKKNAAAFARQYPNMLVTPIPKIEFRFNMSKNPSSQNDFMTAIQYPLKLSFACTAHKIQGSTIKKPDTLAADLTSVKEAAQAYVILSRVEEENQLIILNEFPREKLYPSPIAMQELEYLQENALNAKNQQVKEDTLVLTLNIRSLPKHHENLVKDPSIDAKVIALQETWCHPDRDYQTLEFPGFQKHLVSKGHGKGIATYFKSNFQVTGSYVSDLYQICKVSSSAVDIVNVYCSQGFDKASFLKDLGALVRGRKQCFIVGDFNIDFLSCPKDAVISKITSSGFKQIITLPTHVSGSLLDHVYIRNPSAHYSEEINFPFYSDHAAISIVQSNASDTERLT